MIRPNQLICISANIITSSQLSQIVTRPQMVSRHIGHVVFCDSHVLMHPLWNMCPQSNWITFDSRSPDQQITQSSCPSSRTIDSRSRLIDEPLTSLFWSGLTIMYHLCGELQQGCVFAADAGSIPVSLWHIDRIIRQSCRPHTQSVLFWRSGCTFRRFGSTTAGTPPWFCSNPCPKNSSRGQLFWVCRSHGCRY